MVGFFAPPERDTLATLGLIATMSGAIVAILVVLATKTFPWIRAKLAGRSLEKQLGPILTGEQIERAIKYYVPPTYQDVDPAEGAEPSLVMGAREPLFEGLDRALSHPTEFRYTILLADSGMGKTAALINYTARHLRRFRRRHKIVLIPLGIPDADDRIKAVENKDKTILFLDALDEDTLANVDYLDRLRTLVGLSKGFYRVVITCRTQFFARDDEIPKRTGVIKVGPRSAGEAAEYVFNRIYLSPFSDKEIGRYLRKRYPLWQWKKRRLAREMVKKIPSLSIRPMLLTHIDDAMKSNRPIHTSADLYEVMVRAWIKREEGFIPDGAALREFSELLAVDLYANREKRGREAARREQIAGLASEWSIKLDGWYLTGRSLLNRDGEGYYKFAHRSIMEYLFVSRLLTMDTRVTTSTIGELTDQMNFFLDDLLLRGQDEERARIAFDCLGSLVASGHWTWILSESPWIYLERLCLLCFPGVVRIRRFQVDNSLTTRPMYAINFREREVLPSVPGRHSSDTPAPKEVFVTTISGSLEYMVKCGESVKGSRISLQNIRTMDLLLGVHERFYMEALPR